MTLQEIWTAQPPIVTATLHAAWAASKVGAISMATLFTIASLGVGAYGAATDHMHVLELLLVPVGSAALLVLSLIFSFLITVPVSVIVAMCVYPFLRGLRGGGRKAFGIAGFLVGSLVWLGWRGVGGRPWQSILRILDIRVRNRRTCRLRRWPCVCPRPPAARLRSCSNG
jgi:hypothetical protein